MKSLFVTKSLLAASAEESLAATVAGGRTSSSGANSHLAGSLALASWVPTTSTTAQAATKTSAIWAKTYVAWFRWKSYSDSRPLSNPAIVKNLKPVVE